MKQFTTTFLAASSLLLATAAQAQVTCSIGPKIGYSLTTASFHVADYPDYFSTYSSYRSGIEAGVLAQVGFGSHWAVQPAFLYARKAQRYGTTSYYQPNNYGSYQEYTLGLNYLLLPINLLYSQRTGGQGGQVFLGPYVGWLLGGTYRTRYNEGPGQPTV
ncbi:MAG: PorT family protein, partial [Hymenobacter sp.]